MKESIAKKILLGTRGAGAILFALMLGVLAFMAMEFMASWSLIAQKGAAQGYLYEGKKYLLFMLSELVGDLGAVQNSRFDINQALRDCMLGTADTCDERKRYDLIVYPPAPIIPFAGVWSAPPAALAPITGGNSSKGGVSGITIFYTTSGDKCPASVTELSDGCPLQAMTQFQPLCGGTLDTPSVSTPGGALCTGAAHGFIIYTAVQSYDHGRTLLADSDEIQIQVSSNQLFF